MSDPKPAETPAQQLRRTIADKLRSAFMPAAMADTLKQVDVWVSDVERRLDLLAAQQLRVYYGVEPHEAQLDALASMGDQSRMVGLCKRPTTRALPPHRSGRPGETNPERRT
jgi:hypothetical protein